MTTIAPPPPLSDGGRTAIRVVLVVAAALLMLGGVGTVAGVAVGLSTFRVVTDSQPLPLTMQALTIDTGDVPAVIRVTADREATHPRVDLRLVHSTRAGEQRLDLDTVSAGMRVTFVGAPPRFLGWARAAEIIVALPPDSARTLRLTVQQGMGLLSTQTDLDQLVARTNNGAIILGGSARSIEVNTRHGAIETPNPITVRESFIATTAQGDIDVHFAGPAPRNVQATSRDGDVTIEVPAGGPYRCAHSPGSRRPCGCPRPPTQRSAGDRALGPRRRDGRAAGLGSG